VTPYSYLVAPSSLGEWTAAFRATTQRRQLRLGLRSVDVLDPARPTRQWPSRQQRHLLRRTMFPAVQTAPTPAFRARGKIRSQRVPLNVPTNRVEMLVPLHRKGLEPSLVHVATARTAAVSVPTLRVRNRQPGACTGKIFRLLAARLPNAHGWVTSNTPTATFAYVPRPLRAPARRPRNPRRPRRSSSARWHGSERGKPIHHRLLVSVFACPKFSQTGPFPQETVV